MDIANIVALYLQTNNFGTVGSNIFIGQMPENTNGIWIERIGGTLNNYVPMEETVLNIYSKNTKASSAVTLLENIKRFIHRMHNTTQNASYIYTFLVVGDIEDMARDSQYEKIYKLTLQVVHRDTAIIS